MLPDPIVRVRSQRWQSVSRFRVAAGYHARRSLTMPNTLGQLIPKSLVLASTGQGMDALRTNVLRGGHRWVFSISGNRSWSSSSWRFWFPPAPAGRRSRAVSVEEVVEAIVPRDLAWVRSKELGIRFVLSRTTICHLVKTGEIKAKRAVGTRCVQAWLVDAESVRELLGNRLLERRPKGKGEL